MKVNTGSGMKPNSFRPIPDAVRLRRNDFHRHVVALDNTMAGSLPLRKGGSACQPGDCPCARSKKFFD
jgi:uncharacterized protein YecA (UPF0149 family)